MWESLKDKVYKTSHVVFDLHTDMWESLKDKVYKTNTNTLEKLKNKFRREISTISREEFQIVNNILAWTLKMLPDRLYRNVGKKLPFHTA